MPIYSHYNSKYERWYYNIINNAKNQYRSKRKDVYYEVHHIIPRALGGTDADDNLVLLTYKEHLLCHWLLYKFTNDTDKTKMSFAFWAMCNLKNKHHQRKITPLRILETAKLAHIKEMSNKNSGKGNPMYGSKGGFYGKKHSKKHKQKITGKGNPMYGKTHTQEARQRIAESRKLRKGETKSVEMRNKLSKTATGRKRKYNEDGSWTWQYPVH